MKRFEQKLKGEIMCISKYLGLLALFVWPLAQTATPEAALDAGLLNPGYHEPLPWFKNSFLDIREDVAEAMENSQRVLLYFYQDGCPYCKKLLTENFAIKEIVDKTRANFDVVAINIWGDRDVVNFDGQQTTEKEFAAALKVMFTPTCLFLNEKGEVVLRVNGYYPPHKFTAALDYVSGRYEAKVSFSKFRASNAPPPAKGILHQDPSFLQPPYRLRAQDRTQDGQARPLLVLFEQKQCQACDELHLDIFKRKETREFLDKFDIVLLDMWSRQSLVTPKGYYKKADRWVKDLDVKYAPSMVFFDPGGNEVFRSEAYLKSFHIQSILDYVSSAAYREQPNFQRYIQSRADALEARGIHVNLMD